MQRNAIQTTEGAQGLQPGRDFAGVVGVHRARAAVMTGVQRGEQIDHFGSPDLADHDPVGSHSQRLADKLAHGDLADTLDIGAPRHQLDQVRVRRR